MDPASVAHPSVRLMIADIDGTLVNKEKLVTPRAVQAIDRMSDAGIIFGVTTGRPPAGAKMLVDAVPHMRFIAGFNGGVIVNRDFRVFRENILSAAVAEEVVRILVDNGMDVWVYTDTDWFVRDPNAYRVARESKTVQFQPKVRPNFDGLFDHVAKIVGISQDYELVARCEKLVQEMFGERVSAARSQPYYLDVTHPHANKGEVVHEASEFFAIPAEQIATIGDMANDITMFRKSGVSIAMGNADAEVKKAARYVTGSNEEEGFARAVEDFVLPHGTTVH
jgi:Cof subfamily protein (haloacid dehalogenase superfamily)